MVEACRRVASPAPTDGLGAVLAVPPVQQPEQRSVEDGVRGAKGRRGYVRRHATLSSRKSSTSRGDSSGAGRRGSSIGGGGDSSRFCRRCSS